MSGHTPILTNAVNIPDADNPGYRIIGWRVTNAEAGLSDALFFLDKMRRDAEVARELLGVVISAQEDICRLYCDAADNSHCDECKEARAAIAKAGVTP